MQAWPHCDLASSAQYDPWPHGPFTWMSRRVAAGSVYEDDVPARAMHCCGHLHEPRLGKESVGRIHAALVIHAVHLVGWGLGAGECG